MAKKSLELPADGGISNGNGSGLAGLTARKKANSIPVTLILDNELADRVRSLESEMGRAELRLLGKKDDAGRRDDYERLTAELEAAKGEAEDATVTIRVQACSRRRMEDLIAAHPPTSDQIAAYRKQLKANGLPMNEPLGYNSETFPPALLAECISYPETSLEETTAMWAGEEPFDVWSQGELQMLFSAALTINQSTFA